MLVLSNVGVFGRKGLSNTLLVCSRRLASSSTGHFPPSIPKLETTEENSQARQWITKFRTIDIPKGDVEFTYSRSSGPGGQVCSIPVFEVLRSRPKRSVQNVNKVNTKATLRLSLTSSWIPLWARDSLRKSVSQSSLSCAPQFGT